MEKTKRDKVIKSETVVCIDVDQTLLLWEDVHIKDEEKVTMKYAEKDIHLTPSWRHIDLLKNFNKRKYHIIVWSSNGFDWAEKAIKKLELMDYVDTILSKPIKYVDDHDASGWMGPRIYIEPKKKRDI